MWADPLLAYYFNNAVYAFGSMVENEMELAGRRAEKASSGRRGASEKMVKTARVSTLAKLLEIPITFSKPKSVKAEFSA